MISETLFDLRKTSIRRGWALSAVVFVGLVLLRYIETEEWRSALTAPLSLVAFISVAALMADIVEAIKSRIRLKVETYLLLIGMVFSFILLGLIGASLRGILALFFLGQFFFFVVCVFGVLKSRLVSRPAVRRKNND